MPDIQERMLPLATGGLDHREFKQDIERDVSQELQRCGYLDVRGVSCEYDRGVLTLRGRVPSYYLKQIAQTVVLGRLQHAAVLKNLVEVRSS
jgi:uncharacterized protein YcaQ